MTLPRRILQLALWMSAFLAAYPAVAQRVIEMRGFKFSEYYDAPQETKVKVRLQGARARPLSGGLVEVNTAKVETFREDGLAELVVEAPECIHSSTGRVIYSSGPLLVKTADGSFSIRGEGFLYQQTNSTLFISNNVETVATPDLLKQGKENQADSDGPSSPMHIKSQAFRYSGDDGAGVYSGQVQVTGTNLAVSSELISLKLPVEERRLHEIIAEDNVLLDYAGMSASGQKAVYNVDTEIAEVTGQPAWRSEGREGRADTFIIDRTNRLVLAKGDAWLRMPGQSLAGNLLPNLDNAGVTNQSAGLRAVEIRSANYELRTNNITFQNGVLVTEFEGDRPAGTLSCRQMAVDFFGNQPGGEADSQ